MSNAISKTSSPEDVAQHLLFAPDESLPEGWWNWINVIQAEKILADEMLESVPPYPAGTFAGRGVVICGGGRRLFTNAWVCIRILRHHGFQGPIELWHLDDEVDAYMASLVARSDVRCVNAMAVAKRLPRQPRVLNGWELKAFALLHSRFEQVMLLDADNVPVVNPEFLFDHPRFVETGALFWPDYGRMEASRGIWAATGVPYRDEPEFESGQLVVDKTKSWKALNLAMHYNEHSDFYYKHIHGDKCTFRFAWHRTGTKFAMTPHGIHSLDATMCQHDFDGKRIFQHRNMDKWRLDGANRPVRDFWFEAECRQALAELRHEWSGEVYRTSPMDAEQRLVHSSVGNNDFVYERVGHDTRIMRLNGDGTIGSGAGTCERHWAINHLDGETVLTILGEDGPTCHLKRENGDWQGRWMHHEKMPIVLRKLSSGSSG